MEYLTLDSEQFNKVRRNEDYPRLYDFFVNELPQFEIWMAEQKLTREIMFEHGLARFIVSDVMIYLCLQAGRYYLWDEGIMDFSSRKNLGWIKEYTAFSPYFLWLKKKLNKNEYGKIRKEFRIGFHTQGHHFFMDKIPMRNIDCNNIVNNAWLSGKLLDFVSLDNVHINESNNNQHLYIYCSSAVNLKITGGLPFLKFTECKLSDFSGSFKTLVLQNGNYQEFTFKRCQIDLQLNSANIMHMEVSDCNFKVKCDFVRLDSQCKFNHISNSHYSYQSKSDFFTEVTNLYVEANDYASAGEYYYRKRKALMLESIFTLKNFRSDKFRMTKKQKLGFNIRTFFKGVSDLFNYLCWGFGEKPSRTLMVSTFIILLSSGVYCLNEHSYTEGLIESLYFSIVTFTTLGFGDITQKTSFLRLFSALESLSGLVLMGLFLAGYASKTKRY